MSFEASPLEGTFDIYNQEKVVDSMKEFVIVYGHKTQHLYQRENHVSDLFPNECEVQPPHLQFGNGLYVASSSHKG